MARRDLKPQPVPTGGPDGVKLEEMVLITETGAVPLGLTPYEEDWL